MAQFTVGGVQFQLTKEDVEKELKSVAPEPIRELYVVVNGVQFPVKQALAESSGLQRGAFTSHDAMRVFRKLNLRMGPDESTIVDKLFTALKSLNVFDKLEVQGIVAGLLNKNDRENCVYGLYLRSKSNVQSILSLRQVSDVQAIIMLARSLFELAVDAKLLDVVQDAVEKYTAFSEVEKLRSAEKIVAFKRRHPQSDVDTTIVAPFIAGNKAAIEKRRDLLWPEAKPTTQNAKRRTIEHWSGLKLWERAHKLGDPFDAIYETKYPQMSWYTHAAGLTGFDLKRESYEKLAGVYFDIAGRCYMVLLNKVIDEFKLATVDDKIKNRMRYARIMAHADTDEEVQHLEWHLLG